ARESTEPAFPSSRGRHRRAGLPATTQDFHQERSRRSLFAKVPPFAWSHPLHSEKCGPGGTARKKRRCHATSNRLRCQEKAHRPHMLRGRRGDRKSTRLNSSH